MAFRRVHPLLATRASRAVVALTALLTVTGGGLAVAHQLSDDTPAAVATGIEVAKTTPVPAEDTATVRIAAATQEPAAMTGKETTVVRTTTGKAASAATEQAAPASAVTDRAAPAATAPATDAEPADAERPFTRADLMSARLPEEFGAGARFTAGIFTAGGTVVSLANPEAHWGPTEPIVAEFPLGSGTGLAAMVSVASADDFPAAWVLAWDPTGAPLGGVRLPDAFADRWETAAGLTWDGTALRARYSEVIDGDQQFGNVTDHTVRVSVGRGGPVVESASHVAQDPLSVAGGLVEAVRTGDVEREARIATPAAREVLDFSLEGGPTLRGLIGVDGGSFDSCNAVEAWDGYAWVCGQRLDAPGDPSFGVFVERTAPFEWVVSDIDHLAVPGTAATAGE